MPVRKIVPTYNSLTGKLNSWKPGGLIDFESKLERDFARLLEFNPDVERYTVQPLKIVFKDKEGKTRRYTPDFLVKYRKSAKRKHCLYEIKYAADLKENKALYKQKFKAAEDYARKKRWEFKCFSEKEIDSDQLFNARFLLSYRNSAVDHIMHHKVLSMAKQLKKTTPTLVLKKLGGDEFMQGRYLFTLWHLVATFRVTADLNKKVNMNSVIWVKK
jgi:hypothetical protein